MDPDVVAWVDGDASVVDYLKLANGVLTLAPTPIPGGTLAFSSPIQLDLMTDNNNGPPGPTVHAVWAEAFLEQAVNLGAAS